MSKPYRLINNPDTKRIAELSSALGDYNRLHMPDDDQAFALIYLDEEDRLIAGMAGLAFWGRAYLQMAWVEASHRGKGLGKQLQEALDQHLISIACTGIDTDTFSFQALSFYLACGYREVGRTTGFKQQQIRYFLSKHYS
jgi:GNAT superfamily N-acetyltransferase